MEINDAATQSDNSRVYMRGVYSYTHQDAACRSDAEKPGPDSDDRPGGCNTIRVAVSNEGTYTVSGNPDTGGVAEIEHCAHPVKPDEEPPTTCP